MSGGRGEYAALRRELRDFECKSILISTDITWIHRAREAEAELARLRSQPAPEVERERHPAIVQAEGWAMFHGYCEAEMARLDEKARSMDAGAFDDAAAARDMEWKGRNEKVGAAAVELEALAHRIASDRQPEVSDLFAGLSA